MLDDLIKLYVDITDNGLLSDKELKIEVKFQENLFNHIKMEVLSRKKGIFVENKESLEIKIKNVTFKIINSG